MAVEKKTTWYVGGLHFECGQCGNCCSGPHEGYIWVTRPEIKFIADFLKETTEQLRQKYLQRVGLRTTVVEDPATKDCIFLNHGSGFPQSGGPHRLRTGQKGCMIYPVRPNQCRNWPFWPSNLASQNAWNTAAQKCSGINRGNLHSFEKIEKNKKQKWWKNAKQ